MTGAAPPLVSREPSSSRWREYWRKVLQFDKGRMEPWVALRNAIGVALPLAIGVALGMPLGGLAVSTGALQVSYSDSGGPYAQRAKRMLAACLLCSLAVVVGGLAVRRPLLAGILIVLWALVAGLAVCLGPTADSLGVISLVTLIIYSVQPLTAQRALISGLLALGGGLLQTALALLLWPVRRYEPERRVLADMYGELSKLAVTPAGSQAGPPAGEQATTARETLAGLGTDTSLEAERYWTLLNQAERLRLNLLSLRRVRKRLERDPNHAVTVRSIDHFLEIAAEVLRSIERAINRKERATSGRELLAQLEVISTELRERPDAGETDLGSALLTDGRSLMEALIGQLRSAVRTTTETSPAELEAFAARDATRPWTLRFTGMLAKMRANLTLRSSAFRHAVRLALCLAVGELAVHQLHNHRGYWLTMTIVLVLKQEFAATFSRGLLRIAGTILGLIIATAIFHFLPSGVGLEVLLVLVLVFILRWAGPANYGVFTLTVSSLIVILVAISGVSPKQAIIARGEMTCLGGAIALLTYLLWPTREMTQSPRLFAELLAAYRKYFSAIAQAYIQGRPTSEDELGPLRLAARLARSNMEASLERLRVEPGSTPDQIKLLTATLANSHRFIRAAMTLEILPPEERPVDSAFHGFAADVELTLDVLEAALRENDVNLRRLPDLREDHYRLTRSANAHGSLLNEETDRVTNSLNTLAEQVEAWQKMQGMPSLRDSG